MFQSLTPHSPLRYPLRYPLRHPLTGAALRAHRAPFARKVGALLLEVSLAACGVGLLLMMAPVQPVHAQPAVARQVVAMPDTAPDALLAAGAHVLARIDTGDYLALWQDMPSDLQSRFKRDTFIADMKSTREALGTLSPRNWSGLGRLRYASPSTPQGIPAGLYANVEMSSFTTDGRALIERVSLRIESDGSLRFTGYVPRLAPRPGAAPVPSAATPP